jgi:hypothetical protein
VTRRCHSEPLDFTQGRLSEGANESRRGERLAGQYGFGPLAFATLRLRVTAGIFISALFAAAGCSSPEATRTRGGGPGADVKNWDQPVEMHAGAEPYDDTPCVTKPVECNGPPPVFGPTPPPD